MKKRSDKYWVERSLSLEDAAQKKAETEIKRMHKAYLDAIKAINEDMEKVLKSYMDLDGISEETAKERITEAQNNKAYAELRKLYEETDNPKIRSEIVEMMYAQAYGARLSRYEEVKQKIYVEMRRAGNSELLTQTALHEQTYLASFYGNVYNIAEGLDCGVSFSVVPQNAVNRVLNEKWHGGNYSSRIWVNNTKFITNLQSILENGIIAGHSISRIAESLKGYVKGDKGETINYVTERLARSETGHFHAQAQLDAYDTAGIERYRFFASLSERTCERCAALDGQEFYVSQASEGVNYPIIHPNCRCTTIIGDFIPKTRIARDPLTGKNYEVDGSVTFEEWKAGLTDEQRQAMNTHVRQMKNKSGDKKQYEKYKSVLGAENMPKTFDKFQDLKYNKVSEWSFYKGAYRYVNVNPGADIKSYKCVKELESLGVKGSIHIPKKAINILNLAFDNEHINKQRMHNVTEQEARSFIENAVLSITKRNGITENYYSKNGAAYVNPIENIIKTSFKKEEFKGETLVIMEVINKYGY